MQKRLSPPARRGPPGGHQKGPFSVIWRKARPAGRPGPRGGRRGQGRLSAGHGDPQPQGASRPGTGRRSQGAAFSLSGRAGQRYPCAGSPHSPGLKPCARRNSPATGLSHGPCRAGGPRLPGGVSTARTPSVPRRVLSCSPAAACPRGRAPPPARGMGYPPNGKGAHGQGMLFTTPHSYFSVSLGSLFRKYFNLPQNSDPFFKTAKLTECAHAERTEDSTADCALLSRRSFCLPF